MKFPGIVGMVSLAATLALAIPVAIIGFEFLSRGEHLLGGGFIAISLAMLLLPEYVSRKLPRPRETVKRKLLSLRGGKEE